MTILPWLHKPPCRRQWFEVPPLGGREFTQIHLIRRRAIFIFSQPRLLPLDCKSNDIPSLVHLQLEFTGSNLTFFCSP